MFDADLESLVCRLEDPLVLGSIWGEVREGCVLCVWGVFAEVCHWFVANQDLCL